MIPTSYASETPPQTIAPQTTVTVPSVAQVASAVASEPADVLPPNVLKVAVPMVLAILGLSYLMVVGTICYRLIYVTIHLDGSAVGVQLAGPDLATLSTVLWTSAAVFCVVVVGTQLAGKLLSLFGK